MFAPSDPNVTYGEMVFFECTEGKQTFSNIVLLRLCCLGSLWHKLNAVQSCDTGHHAAVVHICWLGADDVAGVLVERRGW